jgi:hypothetical protein
MKKSDVMELLSGVWAVVWVLLWVFSGPLWLQIVVGLRVSLQLVLAFVWKVEELRSLRVKNGVGRRGR